jgi:hypothetical protein
MLKMLRMQKSLMLGGMNTKQTTLTNLKNHTLYLTLQNKMMKETGIVSLIFVQILLAQQKTTGTVIRSVIKL